MQIAQLVSLHNLLIVSNFKGMYVLSKFGDRSLF